MEQNSSAFNDTDNFIDYNLYYNSYGYNSFDFPTLALVIIGIVVVTGLPLTLLAIGLSLKELKVHYSGKNKDVPPDNGQSKDVPPDNGQNKDVPPDNGQNKDVHLDNGQNKDVPPDNGQNNDVPPDNGQNKDVHLDNGQNKDVPPDNGQSKDVPPENGQSKDVPPENGQNDPPVKELKDHVPPVYVISLLISNLFQIVSLIVLWAKSHWMIMNASVNVYNFGVTASVFFMVVVACERCLFITKPEYRNNLCKWSAWVSAGVWILSIVVIVISCCSFPSPIALIFFGVFLLVPFPLLIFFLVWSVKASSDGNKQLNLVILILLLLIYTVLILPYIICRLVANSESIRYSLILLVWNPLADLIVYFFNINKKTREKLLPYIADII